MTMTTTKTSESTAYTIGDLAREFGVTLRTLRFYEHRGLIAPQRAGLTRFYSEEDKARLALILKGKHLGFTLTEIRAMLDEEAKSGNRPVPDLSLSREQIASQIQHLEAQKGAIEEALGELHRQLMELEQKIVSA
jgi:DNA-binding transcriptional MerR regulator